LSICFKKIISGSRLCIPERSLARPFFMFGFAPVFFGPAL
jgi:hypothetical protein